MKLILQLKHWQFFLVLLLFYWLERTTGDGYRMAGLMLMLVSAVWTWSLGAYGQKILAKKGIASKKTSFLAFNITYVCVVSILGTIFEIQPDYQPYLSKLEKALRLVCGGYLLFAALHTTWFAARTLCMVGNGGEYFWGTTVVYAFFILFPVIGVWAIQPIVNHWIGNPWHNENDSKQSGDTRNLEERAVQ